MKVLFFDFDGTLIDIHQREIEVIHDTVNHFGLTVSKPKVKQLCAQLPSYTDVFKETGLEFTDEAIQYWTAAFVKRYRFSSLREGVKQTLKALLKDYPLHCITSRETVAEVVLEMTFFQIDGVFEHIITREVAAKHFDLDRIPFYPYHEQRTKLYECALAIANSNPEDAIVIGDMGRELQPARELGITTIGLATYESRKEELEAASDWVVSSIAELLDALPELCVT